MIDSIDEIKATLPVETTAAYAAILTLVNKVGEASNTFLMFMFFLILLFCTAWLSLIRSKSLTALLLALSGFIIWVLNIDYKRFSNITANFVNKYIIGPTGDASPFTESLDLIIPSIAILYSVFLAIYSLQKTRSAKADVE